MLYFSTDRSPQQAGETFTTCFVQMLLKLRAAQEPWASSESSIIMLRCEPLLHAAPNAGAGFDFISVMSVFDVQVGQDGHVQCGYRVKRELYLPIYLIDFTIFYVIPLLLAIVLYGLIARVLYLR